MNVKRSLKGLWLVVLALSLGTNGITAETIGFSHVIDCAEVLGHTCEHDAAHEGDIEPDADMTAVDTDRDNERCMFHACPAIFAEGVTYQAEPFLLLTKLQYNSETMQVIERVESLHRPPNT